MLSMLTSYFGDTLAATKELLRAVSMGSRLRGNDIQASNPATAASNASSWNGFPK